ncbi:MFS transporter [Miniimonas arenae]|uniref:MFS transporter n=1 Tax=Miniimonas arenae TaxID=676201 RepID=A0A5C5BCW5_9MICO|nr:MFS transporter [Miniimonas arenae]TNU74096.1 MFS transporter [Miniimonas arenae]
MSLERTRWIPVGLLVVVGIAAAMQFAKVAAIFVPVAAVYDASDTATALLLSAPAFVGLVLGLTAGVYVARLGFRRVLLWCLGIGTVLGLVQAVLPPLPIFIGTRVLEGVAHLGLVVACPVLIILLSAPRHVALAMSIWGTFFGLAFAIAGWLAPALEEASGVGAVFLGHAALLAVLLLVVAFALPRVPGDGPQRDGEAVGFLQAHLEAYRSPRTFLPGLVFVFHTTMYVSLITFLPLFAEPSARGALLVWMPLVSILGTVVAGFVGQYATTPPVVLLAGYLGVAALVVVTWSVLVGEGTVVVAALALMVFSGLIQGATFGLIPTLSRDPRVTAHANGVLTQLGNLGSTIGPPLFASVIVGTQRSDFAPVALLVLALCAGGLVVSAFALRLTGLRHPPQPAAPVPGPAL